MLGIQIWRTIHLLCEHRERRSMLPLCILAMEAGLACRGDRIHCPERPAFVRQLDAWCKCWGWWWCWGIVVWLTLLLLFRRCCRCCCCCRLDFWKWSPTLSHLKVFPQTRKFGHSHLGTSEMQNITLAVVFRRDRMMYSCLLMDVMILTTLAMA